MDSDLLFAPVIEIKGNSLDDGPGIRSVVFFKGCPLSCIWCHNPESKKKSVEISFNQKECIGCFTCKKVCPHKAISSKNPYFIEREKCSLCFACVNNCPTGALTEVGKITSVDEVAKIILKDKLFFQNSGGGATFTGGEPTVHINFISALAQKLKEEGIHIIIETSGLFNYESFIEKVYPYIDEIYMDIKFIDENAHTKYCGVDNKIIKNNFSILHDRYKQGGKKILPRTPLIPGITATEENLHEIKKFLEECDVQEYSLLPYNPLWLDKAQKLGYDLSREALPTIFMSQDEIRRCIDIFNGITVI